MENYNNKRHELGKYNRNYMLFDPFFDDFFSVENRTNNILRSDVKEKENEYEISVEVPGLKKDQISLSIEDGYLTIATNENRTDECKDEQSKYLRRERVYASYQRRFYIGDVEQESISAKLDNGVLYITFPKEAEKKNNNKYIAID
jgi:HSP20 family molecular chaperone IbpA